MAITKTNRIKEVVIRYDSNGIIATADITRVDVIEEDGIILGINSLPPTIVTPEELAALFNAEVSTVVSDLAALQNSVEKVTSDAAKAVSDAKAENAAALASLKAENVRLVVENEALKAELSPVDDAGFAILSPVQIRLALLGAGITSSKIDGIISQIEDEAARSSAVYYWEYSREYHRDHPLIDQFAAALGLSKEQVDAMWAAAAKL